MRIVIKKTIILSVLLLSCVTELCAQETIEPTLEDVSYGPYKEQILNFWKAESDKPTPVVVDIHGGGWIHGPIDPFRDFDKYCLNMGISVVHITYRFCPQYPLPTPVYDAARAIQYVRYMAKEWNIDPNCVIVTGSSAGGCTSLWLATHKDLADRKSGDPVLRESSLVTAAIVSSAQTTIVPQEVLVGVGMNALKHAMNRCAGGFQTNEEMMEKMKQKNVKKLYLEFSPIHHLSKKTVPIFMEYGPLASKGEGGIHDAAYGVMFKEKADRIGLTNCYLKIAKSDKYVGYPGGKNAFVQSVINNRK